MKNEDIILHTTGELSRCYCYTIDAVTAMLYILLRGKDGEAYNVANEDTYISIREMAELVASTFNPQRVKGGDTATRGLRIFTNNQAQTCHTAYSGVRMESAFWVKRDVPSTHPSMEEELV